MEMCPSSHVIARHYLVSNSETRCSARYETDSGQQARSERHDNSAPSGTPHHQNVCLGCGKPVAKASNHCANRAAEESREKMLEVARRGADWLNEKVYADKIQPLLAGIANSVIMSALGVSATTLSPSARADADRIRGTGKRWRAW